MDQESSSMMKRLFLLLKKRLFLVLNALALAIGATGGPLLTRLYFVHGGKRIWFSSWLQTAGFPIILIPLLVSYSTRRRHGDRRLFLLEWKVFAAAAGIGLLAGWANYLYSAGFARLPVSTSSLIISFQLVVTAVFAYFLLEQKFTRYSVGAVFLLTLGAALLAFDASSDRPAGESKMEYTLGFGMMVAAALVFGFVLPLIEWTYTMVRATKITYGVVLEIELVVSIVATAFCTVGMLFNKDFQAIGREAKAFGLGEAAYYVVVMSTAILFQGFFVGSAGVIYYSSSLLSGVIITMMLPVTEAAGVALFHEKFHALKAVSLVLSLLGFVCYFYGKAIVNNTDEEDLTTTTKQQDHHELPLHSKDLMMMRTVEHCPPSFKFYAIES